MHFSRVGQKFNNKGYLKEVISERDKIRDGKSCSSTQVRSVVTDSWKRCLAEGVDAESKAPLIITGNRLATLQEHNKELLLASKCVSDGLADILHDSKTALLLADANGIVINTSGNRSIFNLTQNKHISPGYNWSEHSGGTNAVGTAIALKQAVEIHSAEHFCEVAQVFTCAAAPIFDLYSGEVIGIIDVTTTNKSYNSRNISIALTAARNIEELLRSRRLLKQLHLVDWYHEKKTQWADDGIILLNEKGRVVKYNAIAEQLIAEHGVKNLLQIDSKMISVSQDGEAESYINHLPESIDSFDLELFGNSAHWQGGILVLNQTGLSHTRGYRPPPIKSNAIHATAFNTIIGESDVIKNLKARASRMAKTSAPVLILGETGSGKELFAKAVHDASEFSDGPFVGVNCGAITRELASSELFGYEAGAFTGANTKGQAGKFEQANGGTIFLDEVGELPLELQVNLLRVLQDGVVVRIGGSGKERKINTRVIAATNRNLEEEVENHNFRMDLYYRLKVMVLNLPPLRSRAEDLITLADYFIGALATKYNCAPQTIAPDLEEFFKQHEWPGNVREFYSVLESMFVLSDSDVLKVDDLPDELLAQLESDQPVTLNTSSSGGHKLAELEKQSIICEIEKQHGNLSLVAKSLGIARSTLYRKMKEYQIEGARALTERKDSPPFFAGPRGPGL